MLGEVEGQKCSKSGGQGKGLNRITTPRKNYNVSSEWL